MKFLISIPTPIPILLLGLFAVFCSVAHAQIPVTDVASITSNQIAHAEDIAKWVDSIAQLKTQIDQLNQQISIQGDLRNWAGNPTEAGASLALNVLGENDLAQTFGQSQSQILALTQSLASLQNTSDGSYRAIPGTDLNGDPIQHDALTFRRYSVLDAKQANAAQVADETQSRETELQEEIASTLQELKASPTEAETQKLSAKLIALNGQLAQVESARRRQVDDVALQKMANDERIEEERMAAAELEATDDSLANQRVTAYMKTLKLRSTTP